MGEMDKTWAIMEWWMTPAELLDAPIQALLSKSYQWPAGIRRLYVATWPIAVILRGISIAVLMVIFLIVGFFGHVGGCLNCLWHGYRNPWQ